MGAPGPGSTQSAEEVPAFRAKQQVERAKADASVGAGVKLKHILVHSQQTQEDTPSTKPEQARSERNTLLASLRATPLNPQGWNRLVQLSEESADNAYINEAYDELLSVYPDAVRSTPFRGFVSVATILSVYRCRPRSHSSPISSTKDNTRLPRSCLGVFSRAVPTQTCGECTCPT